MQKPLKGFLNWTFGTYQYYIWNTKGLIIYIPTYKIKSENGKIQSYPSLKYATHNDRTKKNCWLQISATIHTN